MTTDTKTQLTDLLRRKAKESTIPKAEFLKWLDDLRALVEQVKSWLDDVVQERLLVTSETTDPISHNHGGRIREYSLPGLRIVAGDGSTVEMRPISPRVIGAHGRVDLVRGAKLVTLLRDAKGQWSVLHERTPDVRRTPLDERTFLGALRSLLE